ncbi:MAG: response regulator [Bacteroidota bacterium]|nr:response regulator [Bacteroidota bacterium]
MDNPRIILADDVFSNRLLLQNVLEELGYECKMVENGKKLVDEFLANPYEIIFTDIEMPVMNGFEVVRYIRNLNDEVLRKTPVIALTAHNLKEFSSKLQSATFDDILSKPYSTNKFKDIIAKYLH